MKKVIIVFIALMMVLSMGIAIFADPGAFVESPSKNPAPELIEATNTSEECDAEIIITAYGNRDKLPSEPRQLLEEAYRTIVGTKDVGTLNSQLKSIAEKLGISTEDLAVSDLFDVSTTDCDGHGEHGAFDIVMKSETLKNFVALLHYYNGEWRIVEDAEVTHEGTHLEFTEDEFSPFAIVVNTADIVVEPEPDDGFPWWLLLIILLIVIAVITTVRYFYSNGKKKKEENI